MANKFRKEVEFKLDRQTFTIRPTLEKISAIESRFGATLMLLRRIGANDLSVGDIIDLMKIILQKVEAAPLAKDIPELVFNDGAYSFLAPIAEFLANAISTEDVAKPAEDAAGN